MSRQSEFLSPSSTRASVHSCLKKREDDDDEEEDDGDEKEAELVGIEEEE